MIARHERSLRRTALRYSLCEDDADDAYQRSLEILLTKAPSDDPRDLIRWTQTVVKHEALNVRRNRERMLGGPPAVGDTGDRDWVALIPAVGADPAERAERSEAIAHSREALQALKPQELRTLSLLAEGYSYAEIGQITGYSQTKVNRCLAEGRNRFRQILSRNEDGGRCVELRPLLSAFCDDEANERDARTLREHLRACAGCRSTMRAYRAAPGAAAALAPALPASRPILERAHELLASLHARLPGQSGTTDTTMAQVAAAGGTRGAGMAALAKVLAICVGAAGGAAACVATGVAPPIDLGPSQVQRPTLERPAKRITDSPTSEGGDIAYEPAPPAPDPAPQEKPPDPQPTSAPTSTSSPAGGVEFTPEAAPATAAAPVEGGGSIDSSSGSAAGEFGP
jgi:RNA polymerase sigma factor (sigma-70 family)